ncbi:3-deoxy-7-phosphoheptulonate synthase [Pseudomonas sp. zbq_18]|uniref:3-deoxy-7-phosphoheptulonate synthase n=1 Tax=Pseudomonadota TaxID=1224 RepID=UPI00370A50FB
MNAPLNLVATAKPRAEALPTPAQLRQQLPLDPLLAERVHQQRAAIRAILAGRDPRLLVVIGPCSLHDPASALDYGQRLASLQEEVGDQLLLVMRAYLEKPRTTVGWKGLLFDPYLDGSGSADEGLRLSRGLLLDLLRLGLPLASELLQPLAAAYIDDLLGWAAIGARTSESQIHREMVSGLDLPVGFKNGTDGDLAIACDAMQAAAQGHRHFGLDEQGRPALLHSQGNPHTHLVLRGGHQGPNYRAEQVAVARNTLGKRGLLPSIMVDCSHANSGKDPARQPEVLHEVLRQRLAGELSLRGVMLESHLIDGCQPLQPALRYGQSITDACLGWSASEALLLEAARRLRQGFETS